jgi:hypothetical protein
MNISDIMRQYMQMLENAAKGITEADDDTQSKERVRAFTADTPRDKDGRLVHPNVKYKITDKKASANLSSYDSQVVTKMAQNVKRIQTLKTEIEGLEYDVKADARGFIDDLFAATDAALTRVVETNSFEIQLKKAATDVPSTKYAEVLDEFANHLTPELIAVLESIKKKWTTYTDKAGALSITAKVDKAPKTESFDLTESPMDGIKAFFAKFKQVIFDWADKYDQQLENLKSAIQSL